MNADELMVEMNDKDYVTRRHYADSSRLNARSRLHGYNTNPCPWTQWLSDHFRLPDRCRVLELGCGTGTLWSANAARIPAGWDITVTDFSSGMLDEARRNLAPLDHSVCFEVVDATSIPFESASYDAVVANHMLYHAPDCMQAVSEIRRVLRPGGQLYASTVGSGHMIEIHQLAARYMSGKGDDGQSIAANFGLENGREKLERFFGQVELFIYEDSLSVPEAQPVVDYILSLDTAHGAAPETVRDLCRAVEDIIQRDGSMRITKEAGLFIAGD